MLTASTCPELFSQSERRFRDLLQLRYSASAASLYTLLYFLLGITGLKPAGMNYLSVRAGNHKAERQNVPSVCMERCR